ncbi:efflux RND transporter periplasmic adaptor subunit [Vibrio sp. B1Z05]|uniref:efflux RND transporter periplasmic adaptor subunit n=1 Tax=Vibrio sp. B1Z05 TaxID=2654980 RepID=UPI00128B8822|nr:efflux RND transporter periplasmic adaptor subunit [Vibrio sp. B1Z05]MPW37219.1 efflux RND transporter periplasmic adaptor subunit [Vibrio sp. B1Z05]
MKLFPLIISLLLGVLLVGCDLSHSDEITPSSIKPIKTTRLQLQHMDPSYQFLGEIVPVKNSPISFRVGGEIQSISVEMGQKVSKGQLLASLDDADLKLAVKSATTEFVLAKSEYQRAKQLQAKKLISKDALDQAYTQYKTTEAALEQAKTDLSYGKIYAPFSGVVSMRHSNAHQVVAPLQPIVNIIDNSSYNVSVSVPVIVAHRLMGRQPKLQFVSDTLPDHPFPAQIIEISSQPDLDTNSYLVKVAFNSTIPLMPGHSGQLQVFIQSDQSAPNPIQSSAWIDMAEVNHMQKGHVWIYDPSSSKVHRRLVSVNLDTGVVFGVKSGEILVESGVQTLVENQIVRPWIRERGI